MVSIKGARVAPSTGKAVGASPLAPENGLEQGLIRARVAALAAWVPGRQSCRSLRAREAGTRLGEARWISTGDMSLKRIPGVSPWEFTGKVLAINMNEEHRRDLAAGFPGC
ncbi:MAG: hypothetical protein A4E65_02472 [Syntrophorhabdus sp. PtaU1.Bin153]|nr:MAG: hypothetical protein A4E65_02472 [Syntrophorhabdus sp. PtaU1.Bin153]